MKITNLYYKSESTGSIDPSSTAYRSIWNYTPTEAESKEILDTVKINSKITLRQYFEALKSKNTKLLEETKLKPRPDVKVDQDESRMVGGTNTTWTISALADGKPLNLSSAQQKDYYLDFPKIVFQKGTRENQSADHPSIELIEPQKSE